MSYSAEQEAKRFLEAEEKFLLIPEETEEHYKEHESLYEWYHYELSDEERQLVIELRESNEQSGSQEKN